MIIKSFSKINLTLRVLKKLKNGMHNIETNSVLTNLFDVIKRNHFKEVENKSEKVSSDNAKKEADTAIITDPKLRTKKTIKKLKNIAGRVLNKKK